MKAEAIREQLAEAMYLLRKGPHVEAWPWAKVRDQDGFPRQWAYEDADAILPLVEAYADRRVAERCPCSATPDDAVKLLGPAYLFGFGMAVLFWTRRRARCID